jgi:hypothetical protein
VYRSQFEPLSYLLGPLVVEDPRSGLNGIPDGFEGLWPRQGDWGAIFCRNDRQNIARIDRTLVAGAGQRFASARWLYVSCFSGRLCEEAACPLRKMPQLSRIAREKMHAAHLCLWLRPGTYSSEGKRRVGVTSARVRPADVRVLLPWLLG